MNGSDRKRFPSGRTAILVFARGARREGRRKRIGLDAASSADAAALMLERTLAAARGSGADLWLAGDAELAHARPASLPFLAQRGESFGERLRNAAQDVFALGYRHVVIVGADTPALTAEVCRQALRQLQAGGPRTVVIGPSRDGGYYLIGFNRFDPRAFEGIPWCTRRVLSGTRRALAGSALVWLPRLSDADDAGSLRRAVREAGPCAGRALARLAAHLIPETARDRVVSLPILPVSPLAPVRRGPPAAAGLSL